MTLSGAAVRIVMFCNRFLCCCVDDDKTEPNDSEIDRCLEKNRQYKILSEVDYPQQDWYHSHVQSEEAGANAQVPLFVANTQFQPTTEPNSNAMHRKPTPQISLGDYAESQRRQTMKSRK